MAIEFLGDILTPSMQLGELQSNGTDTITLKAPDDLTSGSSTYTLPLTYPTTDGYVLSSLTNGTMSWAAGGGASTNIGTDNLTITDQLRTLTLNSTPGYKFSILQSNLSELQQWKRNATTIWDKLEIDTHSGLAGRINFIEGNTSGVNYIGLKAPDTVTSDITYTLPEAPTASNKVLASSTLGVMSWVDQGANYKNTIVAHQTDLVPKRTTFTAGDYHHRGENNEGWAINQWWPYTGTYSSATGWESEEIAMSGIKIGSVPISGTNAVTLNASISVDASVISGGAISGKIYVWQYTCAAVMGAAHNAKLLPEQTSFAPFSITNSQNDAGTCVSFSFGMANGMGVGDYYMVGVYCATSNLYEDDPVWFNYSITQTESLS
tara:strand:+ start:224 stop:1357 length:1134 start_codon:yes stop_codon:yes gene_type:complete